MRRQRPLFGELTLLQLRSRRTRQPAATKMIPTVATKVAAITNRDGQLSVLKINTAKYEARNTSHELMTASLPTPMYDKAINCDT
jgi:hypothetical protein